MKQASPHRVQVALVTVRSGHSHVPELSTPSVQRGVRRDWTVEARRERLSTGSGSEREAPGRSRFHAPTAGTPGDLWVQEFESHCCAAGYAFRAMAYITFTDVLISFMLQTPRVPRGPCLAWLVGDAENIIEQMNILFWKGLTLIISKMTTREGPQTVRGFDPNCHQLFRQQPSSKEKQS